MPVTINQSNRILYEQQEMERIFGAGEELLPEQIEQAKRMGIDIDKAKNYYQHRDYENCLVPRTEVEAINERAINSRKFGSLIRQPVKLSQNQEGWAARMGVDPDRAGAVMVEDEQSVIPRAEREAAEEKKKRNGSHWDGKNWQ